MKLAPDQVCIQRLRVRAPQGRQQDAVDQLQRAAWPDGGEAWVLIRRLEVRAPLPWLGARATAVARELAARALPGGAPGAGDALAVRFASLVELLAWLSADLAAGRAQALWYWRSWTHLLDRPSGQALHDLWQEWIAYLPSVTARLAEIGALGPVWAALTPGQALSLQAGLSHYTGWDLPRPAAPTANVTGPVSPPRALISLVCMPLKYNNFIFCFNPVKSVQCIENKDKSHSNHSAL